jgi:hypothetical protein
MLMGSRRLYDFADHNPAIMIRSPRYTHDALVLGNSTALSRSTRRWR